MEENKRKKREYGGFLAALFAGAILGFVPFESIVGVSIIWVIQTFCIYEAIKAISTYNLNYWKEPRKVKIYLYIGCLFGGIGGVIVYYILKSRQPN